MNIFTFLTAIVAPDLVALLKLSKLLKLRGATLKRLITNGSEVLTKKINNLSNIQKKLFSQLALDLVSDPKEVASKLGKLGKSGRKLFSETTQSISSNKNETKALSSSWIRKGNFVSTSIGVGELTITTKKGGKNYTYPGVPYKVWFAMKKATGKNGSGAGSVFWALYLRGYANSYIGQFLSKIGKITGIKTPATSIKDLVRS